VFQFLLKRLFAAVVLVLFVTFITFAVMKINFTLPEINFVVKIPFTQINFFEIHSDKTLIQTGDPLAELKKKQRGLVLIKVLLNNILLGCEILLEVILA
jgi:ABC-type dipeptide/oligopeptide/nickel transport system permease component